MNLDQEYQITRNTNVRIWILNYVPKWLCKYKFKPALCWTPHSYQDMATGWKMVYHLGIFLILMELTPAFLCMLAICVSYVRYVQGPVFHYVVLFSSYQFSDSVILKTFSPWAGMLLSTRVLAWHRPGPPWVQEKEKEGKKKGKTLTW